MGVIVVVPVHNGESGLESLCRRLSTTLSSSDRLVLVDDGSSDGSWAGIRRLSESPTGYGFPIQGIRLDRNRGQQAALMAALTLTAASTVVTMDDDDSHPASAISALSAAIRNGNDLAYALPPSRPGTRIRRMCSRLHQFHIRMITGAAPGVHVGSFRAIKGTLVQRVLDEPARCPYLSIQCLSLRPAPRVAMVRTGAWPTSRRSRFGAWNLISLELKLAYEYGFLSRIFRKVTAPTNRQVASSWIAETTPS